MKQEAGKKHNSFSVIHDSGNLKVALVHDWFVGGGAELVVEQLHKIYPEAPIYTSYCSDEWQNRLDNEVITGYLQNWPFSKLRKFIPPLRILWFSKLKFDNYDLVISSSGAEAKGIKTNKPTLHVNYCHAPTHYYWSRYDDYLKNPGFGFFNPLARIGLKLLVGPLRKWDYRAAQRADYIIANSSYTKQQVKKYYGRDSFVIYPPINTKRFEPRNSKPGTRHGFVITGRQTTYKRIDLAVAACTKLGLPLVVLGKGPQHKELKKIAGKSVTFLRGKSDEELAEYLQTSEAFIFPGVDDFGIAAVEALAAGTPVIAYKAGGALDYIEPDKNGVFFDKQDVDTLAKALEKFDATKFNNSDIASGAQKFSAENFRKNFKSVLKDFGHK